MHLYLPKVKMVIDEFKIFREKIDIKIKEAMSKKELMGGDDGFDKTKFDHLSFLVNSCRTELGHHKKMFT